MTELALPTTRYARSGEVSIAYQTMGGGSIHLILVPGIISHVEFLHEFPGYTDYLRRLAAFARVVPFDKRGQGLSDRVLGFSEGASMSALFAATYPERTSHLIIWGGFARFTNTADYELMFSEEAILK